MTSPDAFDDTAANHERLETELLAQDRDAARVSTADVDETTARQLVSDLVDDGLVTAVAEQRVLVHEPSGHAFDSAISCLPSWLVGCPRRLRGRRMMQQTLSGCAFCETVPGSATGVAHTWGKDDRVTHQICVDCAVQEHPDPDKRDHTPAMAVDSLWTHSPRSRGFVSNSAISKVHCSSALAVAPVDPRRIGPVT